MFNRLIFDKDLQIFLESTQQGCSGRISSIFIYSSRNFIKEEGNFIMRIEDSNDTLSYLPKSKFNKVIESGIDPYSDGIGRVSIKVGRFIKKFLSKDAFIEFDITDKSIEIFVNHYKSYFSQNEDKLVVVSGDDIKKLYLEENYWSPDGKTYGSLWNSCMRQSNRNKFLNIYTKNESVKMLVLMSDDGKVRARALLWDDVKEHNSENTYKVMDRIYTFYDHDVSLFKKWALKNGYIYKHQQSAKSERFFEVNGEILKLDLYVNLENCEFSYYPYLDTFKFFNTYKNRFSNSDRFNWDYKLVQSDGSLEREREEDVELDFEGDWDDDF
jgi:hypothetical protein